MWELTTPRLRALLAIMAFIIHYPDEEAPRRRDRSGWASTWATVEIPPAIALVNTGRLPITNRGKPASDHFRLADVRELLGRKLRFTVLTAIFGICVVKPHRWQKACKWIICLESNFAQLDVCFWSVMQRITREVWRHLHLKLRPPVALVAE
jgi:hypothetical protein